MSSERAERMRVELDGMDVRLEEEKKRSAELLQQVTLTLPVFVAKVIGSLSFQRNIAFCCNLAVAGEHAAEVSSQPERRTEKNYSSGAAGNTNFSFEQMVQS